jgi:hypothetical protein
MSKRAVITAVAAGTLAASLAGCGQGQFYGPPAPPPPRPSAPFGPGAPEAWPAAAAYLKAHPASVPKGMAAGILVASTSHGYACLSGWCHTWSGTVVIAGDRSEPVSSDEGDDGMASLAAPGDEIEFPAADLPVDAPGDDGNDTPAKVLVYGAVAIR